MSSTLWFSACTLSRLEWDNRLVKGLISGLGIDGGGSPIDCKAIVGLHFLLHLRNKYTNLMAIIRVIVKYANHEIYLFTNGSLIRTSRSFKYWFTLCFAISNFCVYIIWF